MSAEIIQGPGRTAHGEAASDALDALQGIIVKSRQAGSVNQTDHAAFAVCALALLGEGWELQYIGSGGH